MSSLVRAFQEATETDGLGPATPPASDELGPILAALLARAQAAYPRLQVAEEAFGRSLARAAGAEGLRSLATLAAEDLYLACACATGAPGAAAAFELRFGVVIQRAVGRVLAGAADRQEAAQLTRRALLVGSAERPPKIATYLGRGSLEGWVSVSAIRVAVSLGRSERTERRLRERTAADVVDGGDPELLAIKGQLRREIEEAFGEALERLEDRERLALRLYLVAGMSMIDIGKTFGTSASSVSRLLSKARKRVLTDVRSRLGKRLKVPKGDLASIARLVASQLDMSISRLLGP